MVRRLGPDGREVEHILLDGRPCLPLGWPYEIFDRVLLERPRRSPARPPTADIGATVEAIRAAGLEVDAELWIPASECSQCYAGCVDDPKTEV
ncbi:hypothetical protein ACWENQ_07095 [Nonomuraea sp. NPDC004354]